MRILVTGSNGLIGGEAVAYFGAQGHTIVGADNNMRRDFFGESGDTLWNLKRLRLMKMDYIPTFTDIRKLTDVRALFRGYGPFDAIIHCAAQPSHDKAREIPIIDFEVNAVGTLNLLEQTRLTCPEAVFIFMSTNKVYGTAPNELDLVKLPTRFDYAHARDHHGISESMRIDQSTHSIFGVSKVAADLMVQEYAKSFAMRTAVLRGGCLTGPHHSGVELHGFLSYLVKTAMHGGHYKIYGYQGKQVRDNIHSIDVVKAMEQIILDPLAGEVYNIGGGRENSVSIIEAIQKVEDLTGPLDWEYVPIPRIGDHICYISDLRKFKDHYPAWSITKSVDDIIHELVKEEER